jgi:hypothetical protein
MPTLIEHAASIVRNSLHQSWHAREQSAEPYGLPDDGVRMVMSEFGVAAYDIWRTGADQRATSTGYAVGGSACCAIAGLWQSWRHARPAIADKVLTFRTEA